jgi:hypothetical protein
VVLASVLGVEQTRDDHEPRPNAKRRFQPRGVYSGRVSHEDAQTLLQVWIEELAVVIPGNQIDLDPAPRRSAQRGERRSVLSGNGM